MRETALNSFLLDVSVELMLGLFKRNNILALDFFYAVKGFNLCRLLWRIFSMQ
jgi:hypothetical protein